MVQQVACTDNVEEPSFHNATERKCVLEYIFVGFDSVTALPKISFQVSTYTRTPNTYLFLKQPNII